MKVAIEIPDEFVSQYKEDRFKDSLNRCIFDLKDLHELKDSLNRCISDLIDLHKRLPLMFAEYSHVKLCVSWGYDIEVLEMLLDSLERSVKEDGE